MPGHGLMDDSRPLWVPLVAGATSGTQEAARDDRFPRETDVRGPR
jgi:hypothetical protein